MELEELKQNWNIMEERLGRLEMEQRQQLNNKVVSKVKQVQDRVLRRFTVLILCLPLMAWLLVRNQVYDFSVLTWVLLFLFVVVILARQLTWMLLLRKIDCLKMTVREVCLAESRFRMSFKVGIAVSVLCAVPLLVSMIWDMSQMGDRYILIGAWTGLVVGGLIGIRLFLKAWSGIKRTERGNNGFAIVILKNESTPSTHRKLRSIRVSRVEGVFVFYRTVCYGGNILI